MKFVIKSMSIENFRCFEKLDTDLWHNTVVWADNESGKSTLASAILWCLTGKDVEGNTSFEIVPTGKYGEASPSVELECMIDDRPVTLKRVYKAKHTRDGSFSDYVTTTYVNDVEKGARKFQEYISEHICPENVFKILGNPYTFVENCPREPKELVWQAQRRLLMNLVGTTSDSELVQSNERWKPLEEPLLRYESATEYQKKLKKETSELEKNADFLAVRLSQQKKNIHPTSESSPEKLRAVVDKLNAQKRELIAENAKYQAEQGSKPSQIQAEIYKLEISSREMVGEYQKALAEVEEKRYNMEREADDYKREADQHIAKQARYATEVERLERSKVSEYCESCGAPLKAQVVRKKETELSQRISNGKKYVELERKKAETLMAKRNELVEKAEHFPEPVYPAKEKEIQEEISKLKEELESLPGAGNAEDYEERMGKLDIESENARLAQYVAEQNKKCKEACAVLESEHRETLKKLSTLQMNLDLCKDFISSKCKTYEDEINSLFKHVKFKLFEQNKSNDDVREICSMTFNGHEYADLSASTKLIACMELVEAFQRHYDVYVPIIIDNAEGVTQAVHSGAQTVKLYVKEELCPECGGKSGRRNPSGTWTCQSCGHEWHKRLTIEEE